MSTVINNPGNNPTPVAVESSGAGPIVAVLIALVLVVIFFVYILPAIRSSQAPQSGTVNVNLKLPTTGNGTTNTPPATTGGGY